MENEFFYDFSNNIIVTRLLIIQKKIQYGWNNDSKILEMDWGHALPLGSILSKGPIFDQGPYYTQSRIRAPLRRRAHDTYDCKHESKGKRKSF
jgi:replicative DNA helicase